MIENKENEILNRLIELENKADMWRDEFMRIKALVYNGDSTCKEIEGICNRALDEIESKISLISQIAISESINTALRSQLEKYKEVCDKLAKALTYGNDNNVALEIKKHAYLEYNHLLEIY